MIIDTNKKVIDIQLRRLLSLLGIIALIISIILLCSLPNTVFGLNKYHWAIVVAVLFTLTIIVDAALEYTYIYYNDETDKIILRFFSLTFFNKKKKQSIEIPKSEFTSFILDESLFGLKKEIILRRYYKSVEAKYPAICLSILSKEQYAQLLLSLDYNSKKANKK